MNSLLKTNFNFPGQLSKYEGKVRDVYFLDQDLLIMVASDRISAFDVILPRGIPGKGQMLNQIANFFLDRTSELVPNWKISSPDPMVTMGKKAHPFKVEMVIRGYLTGHAWRTYRSGKRELCGVPLPEGMRENEAFPNPIITPTTKADQGDHDEDISRQAILDQGLIAEADYQKLEEYTRALFAEGQTYAQERGLILVDTKYEFGRTEDGQIVLIDEIHTPDSSRYFYADGYQERLSRGEKQKQLSKEFVREWLIENGFQGKADQTVPEMSDAFVQSVHERYVELFEKLIGHKPSFEDTDALSARIENNVTKALKP